MTNYTKATNFAAKDSLASGNAAKVVKGTEIDTEFTNIETAVNSKSDSANPVFTGVAEFDDGSASAPSITNTADTNTGLFFPAADTIAFAEGGTETMRLDSSGNLGLGVTPSAWTLGKSFEVNALGSAIWSIGTADIRLTSNVYYNSSTYKYAGTGTASILLMPNDGTLQFSNATSGSAGGTISFTNRLTLDASGNLGIGTSSPLKPLDVVISGTGDQSLISFRTTGASGQGMLLGVNTTNSVTTIKNNATSGYGMAFYSGDGSSESMRIDSSGNLLVNTTTLPSSSGSGVQIYNNSGQAGRLNIGKNTSGLFNAIANYYSGTYVGGVNYDNTSTSFPTSSDVRLKKDIVDAGSASAKIDQIRIVSHGWKHDDAVVEFGVIAQELVNVAPQAVSAGDDGEEVEVTWGVDYSKLVPMLIKAHQEQQAIITQLQADVAALKGQA